MTVFASEYIPVYVKLLDFTYSNGNSQVNKMNRLLSPDQQKPPILKKKKSKKKVKIPVILSSYP